MNSTSRTIASILLAAVWISISEFLRNQILFPHYWTEHYNALGITFPSAPVNGAVWGIWALCYAVCIFVVARKFSLIETFLLSWLFGFVLMWLVIGNLGVLPYSLLYAAIPLSLLESFGASFIVKKMM